MIRGVAYPLAVDGTGNLVVATDEELYRGHILSVLETEPGENPLRLAYGTPGVLFSTTQNLQSYASDVLRRLREEIPQCEFASVGVVTDSGDALLEVYWSIRGVSQNIIQVSLV